MYLFIFFLPIIIISLMRSVIPTNPKSRHFLMAMILRGTLWPLWGHRGPICCRCKVKMKVNNWNSAMTTTTRYWLRAYLFALTMASLKIGCQVEPSLRCLRQSHLFCFHALASIKGDLISSQVHFDSDSFLIRIDNHALYCMAHSPHLFEDLILLDVGKVDGINDRLAILGKGTFKFSISNNDGRVNCICIPNSLYLPKLHGCLLSPQHWAQEAGDNQTWMGNFAHCCVLHWFGDQKTVPFHTSTNTLIFHTASSSSMYTAFVATFEAMEAPFFRRETDLQLPGQWFPREYITPEDLFHDQHLELQERMENPIAFHAKMMGDIMYYHQTLQQPDAKQFANAVVKEVNGHVDNKHLELVKQEEVAEDAQVVPSVWSMQLKRNLTTNKITKHKARLNLHGGKQVFGMNYFKTYAPVVTWFAIRLVIIMGIIFNWALC
jgi:hypothetical protein